jgi:D-alanyl-D-alanine carboxypeptidase (penicillin-binding protein 5/6)
MNKRARELGLSHTHYSTPVGLDDPGNYSSARDLATLARRDLRDPTFAKVVDLESAQLESGSVPRTVVNRNALVLRYPYVSGVKTGHTLQAGYVLVGSAERRGAKVISAVLGTSSEAARDADSIALLDWGLAQFRHVRPVKADRPYATADVKWHDGDQVGLVASRAVRVLTRRGEKVERRVDAPSELGGPLDAGAEVGEVEVVQRGKVVRRVPLVTASSVRGASTLHKAVASIGGPGAAVALLLVLGVAGMLALRVRANRSTRGRERAR